MNKRIIFSGVSILSALGLMIGGAFAAFSSTASNNGNTFAAGSLVLAINGLGGTGSSPVFTVSNAAPGDVTGTQVLNLSNVGSVGAGTTVLTGISVTPTPVSPNLGDKLNLELWNDVNDDGIINGGDTQIGITKPLTDAQWTSLSLGFGLPAGGHHKVLARITFDSSADNTYQSTSVSFNFNFQANQ